MEVDLPEIEEDTPKINKSGLVNLKNSVMLKNASTLNVSRQIHFKAGDDFFEDLPDELFLQILSYVKEGTTLARLAVINKRWKGIVDNFDKLWMEIGKVELNLRESAFVPVNNSTLPKFIMTSPKHVYVSRVKALIHERKERARKHAEAEYRRKQIQLQQKAEKRSSTLRGCLKNWGTVIDYINLVLVTIFTALLAVRLEKGNFLNWYSIFSPLWVLSFFTLSYLIFFDIGRLKYGEEVITKGGRQLYIQLVNESSNNSSFKTAVTFVFSTYTSVIGRLCSWVYFLMFTFWFIVLPIRLEEEIISDSLLFGPMIAINIFSIVSAIIWMIRNTSSDDDRLLSKFAMGFVMIVCGACFTAFFGLLWKNMTDDMNWHTVFVPLYVLFTIIIIQGIVSTIFGLTHMCSDDEGGSLIGWCCCGLCAFPCILSFIVYMGKHLQDTSDLRYITLFVPIFVLEGITLFWLLCVHVGNLCFASEWDDD